MIFILIFIENTINKVNEEPGENEISLYYAQRETNFGKNLIGIKVNNAW